MSDEHTRHDRHDSDVADTTDTTDTTDTAGDTDTTGDTTGAGNADDAGGGVPLDAAAERAAVLAAQAQSGKAIPLDEFKQRSRRSFLTGALGITAGIAGWKWIQTGRTGIEIPYAFSWDVGPETETIDGIPAPLRKTLELNEGIWSNFEGRSAPEYDISDASPIPINGRVGIREEIDLDGYTVRVEGPDGELLDELPIEHFGSLPQHDMVIEHKCIEGWSNITHWRGARFRDFHEPYAELIGDASYVEMETPDGEYYVGWDLDAILHPQTMLALEMGGRPLGQRHGAPLRLATPNKYGIKCIKRIAVIRYSRERTRDYWAERSYDWYAGL